MKEIRIQFLLLVIALAGTLHLGADLRRALILLAAGMLLAGVPAIVWGFLPEWWLRVHYPVAQLLVVAGLVPPRGGLSG